MILDQCKQRVWRLLGVNVQQQPVLVGRARRQVEDFGCARLAKIHDQTHHARCTLADPNAGNEGIIGPNLSHQLAKRGVELQAINVNDHAIRPLEQRVSGGERYIAFDGQAGVVRGWPQPHRDDAGPVSQLSWPQRQHRSARQPAQRRVQARAA